MTAVRNLRNRRELAGKVIGFSLSCDAADAAALGIGAEHLREALLQIARPLLRAGAAVAYGGTFQHFPTPAINFTLELLQLIREEQQASEEDDVNEPAAGGLEVGLPTAAAGQASPFQGLYNHQAWPDYLALSKPDEAEWVSCCQVVRVSQQIAGFDPRDILPDDADPQRDIDAYMHAVACRSALRRSLAYGCVIPIDTGTAGTIMTVPPISARVFLGGKITGFNGLMPGVLEELLYAAEAAEAGAVMQGERPLFIMGGFGGAAGCAARLIASGAVDHAPELTPEFYANPVPGHDDSRYGRIVREWPKLAGRLPPTTRSPAQAFEALRRQLRRAVADPLGFFQNGLSVADNRRLLLTVDPLEATRLVLRGLDGVRYWADVAEADGSI